MWHSPGVQPRPRRSNAQPHKPGNRVVLVGAALIAVELGFRIWAIRGSWFQFDDFSFITRVIHQPLTPDLAFEGYGGHLMPAGFALTWLYVRSGPLEFTPYVITLVTLQAVAFAGMLALLISLFGRRWGILPPLALYLFSSISLPAFIWWAAGINQLALQIALTWGLFAHLAYLRTRRLRWLLVTVLIMAGCLAFYEKVLLCYAAIAILTLAYFSSGPFFARLGTAWKWYRRAIIVHVVCGAAYIGLYVAVGVELPGGSDTTDFPLLSLTGNMVGRSLFPALVGGPLEWKVLTGPFQLADAGAALIIAACLAILALVIHIDRCYLRSRRAWVMPLFFLGCDIALIGSARASVLGPVIGLEFRYLTELGLVFALGIGLATMPLRGATETVRRTEASPFLDSREWIALSTVVVCFLALFSSFRYAEHWQESDAAHRYFDNADATLGTEDQPTPLANISVPQYIMWGYEYPRNTTRYVLSMFSERMSFPQVSVDNLFVLGDDGKVAAAAITGVRASIPPTKSCGYRATSSHPAVMQLDGPVVGKDWWVRMSYLADESAEVTIEAGDAAHEVELPAGLRNVYFQAGGDFTSIQVRTTTPDVRVCLIDASLGLPQALAAGPSR